MNGEDKKNNTEGSVSRNTYYNMDVPEWRCENCGRFNQREARFCRSCGSPGPMVSMEANGVYVADMPKKKSGTVKRTAVVLVIVLVVAAITVAVIRLVLTKDDKDNTPTTGKQTETVDANSGNIDVVTNPDQNTGDVQEPTETPYYSVGGTYYIQAKEGLKVREGPGKKYNQVYRDNLSPDEYAQSLNGDYACLKQGSSVVCQEMSDDGNWMRISSGWICVWDGNETLVR